MRGKLNIFQNDFINVGEINLISFINCLYVIIQSNGIFYFLDKEFQNKQFTYFVWK